MQQLSWTGVFYVPRQDASGDCNDVSLNGERSLRRFGLVTVQKARLQLSSKVTAALTSHSRDHRLTASGFFPCSIDRETCMGTLQMDAARPSDYVLPTMAFRLGPPAKSHHTLFHQALQDRKIIVIPDIHYSDVHRLQSQLLQAPELQLHPRRTK